MIEKQRKKQNKAKDNSKREYGNEGMKSHGKLHT